MANGVICAPGRGKVIKENICIKTIKNVRRALKVEGDGIPYRPDVKICLERARLVTEAYKATEGEPMVIRRAKALAHILENMTVFIPDHQLIVGEFASDSYSLPTYPELYWRWLEKAVEDGYKDLLSDEGRRELKEINKYWRPRAVHGKERDLLPDDIKPYWYFSGPLYWAYQWEEGAPNYEKILKVGLKGILKEAEDKLAEISNDKTIPAKEYVEKRNFLEGAIITLKAAINFAKRYAQKAREMAEVAAEPDRKVELLKIAEVCDWVPENPARTLHDALQSFWFIHLITHYIDLPMVGNGTRFDQIMYPFYKKDKDEGRIDRDEALELVECLWLKLNDGGFLHPPIWTGQGGGGLGWHTMNIGGVTPEGEDATNEMTYLALDATCNLRTLQPPLALRYHDKINPELVRRAIDVLATGVAQPAIFNDKVLIPMFVRRGIPIEDARNYGIDGCMNHLIQGKNMVLRPRGPMLLPKCLELALCQGVDKFSGKQLGPVTPDPRTFTSIEDIMEAFLEQYRFFCEKLIYIGNISDALYEEYLPRPFLTALFDEGIERAVDCRKWSYYPRNNILNLGANNVADALAAIKKLIFEEKRLTWDELLDALKNNWEGREDMRQVFLNAPKFGNDDDYVDLIARQVHYRTAKEASKFISYYGITTEVDGSAATSPYGFSYACGATPDGRKDGEPFHDGSISPEQGMDKKGPTAALKSISKIDPLLSANHLYNQSFHPAFLKGENRENFARYLKTWSDLGLHHIQFTVVDRETLLDAQKYPEKHTDLIVRVCGYSAYFIDLSKGLQDDIIARTEQKLG